MLSPASRLGLIAFATVVIAGCDDGIAPERSDSVVATRKAMPSRWHQQDAAVMVALEPEEQRQLLAAAVTEARASAESARVRWSEEDDGIRGGWAIKWAAGTEDGTTEYLWVEPVRWSPFRIEGRLASAPRSRLRCGRGLDELVHFPVEQLVDWVRFESPDFTGAKDGGLTVDVLVDRFGAP